MTTNISTPATSDGNPSNYSMKHKRNVRQDTSTTGFFLQKAMEGMDPNKKTLMAVQKMSKHYGEDKDHNMENEMKSIALERAYLGNEPALREKLIDNNRTCKPCDCSQSVPSGDPGTLDAHFCKWWGYKWLKKREDAIKLQLINEIKRDVRKDMEMKEKQFQFEQRMLKDLHSNAQPKQQTSFFEQAQIRFLGRNPLKLDRSTKKNLQQCFATPCASLTTNNCFCEQKRIRHRCTYNLKEDKNCKYGVKTVIQQEKPQEEPQFQPEQKIQACTCKNNGSEDVQYLNIKMHYVDSAEECSCSKESSEESTESTESTKSTDSYSSNSFSSKSSIEEKPFTKREMYVPRMTLDEVIQTEQRKTIEQDVQTLKELGVTSTTQTLEIPKESVACECCVCLEEQKKPKKLRHKKTATSDNEKEEKKEKKPESNQNEIHLYIPNKSCKECEPQKQDYCSCKKSDKKPKKQVQKNKISKKDKKNKSHKKEKHIKRKEESYDSVFEENYKCGDEKCPKLSIQTFTTHINGGNIKNQQLTDLINSKKLTKEFPKYKDMFRSSVFDENIDYLTEKNAVKGCDDEHKLILKTVSQSIKNNRKLNLPLGNFGSNSTNSLLIKTNDFEKKNSSYGQQNTLNKSAMINDKLSFKQNSFNNNHKLSHIDTTEDNELNFNSIICQSYLSTFNNLNRNLNLTTKDGLSFTSQNAKQELQEIINKKEQLQNSFLRSFNLKMEMKKRKARINENKPKEVPKIQEKESFGLLDSYDASISQEFCYPSDADFKCLDDFKNSHKTQPKTGTINNANDFKISNTNAQIIKTIDQIKIDEQNSYMMALNSNDLLCNPPRSLPKQKMVSKRSRKPFRNKQLTESLMNLSIRSPRNMKSYTTTKPCVTTTGLFAALTKEKSNEEVEESFIAKYSFNKSSNDKNLTAKNALPNLMQKNAKETNSFLKRQCSPNKMTSFISDNSQQQSKVLNIKYLSTNPFLQDILNDNTTQVEFNLAEANLQTSPFMSLLDTGILAQVDQANAECSTSFLNKTTSSAKPGKNILSKFCFGLNKKSCKTDDIKAERILKPSKSNKIIKAKDKVQRKS